MSRVAPLVPEESDLLCEGCGYTLNGLPLSGNCPECGRPIEQSVGDHRQRTPFEQSPSRFTFFRTLGLIFGGHKRFFRNLTTRRSTPAAAYFARINLLIASALFALAATGHLVFLRVHYFKLRAPFAFFGFLVLINVTLTGLNWLAAWLSALEARYWGMRLPYLVVKRGLQFHSADYLPVGMLAVCYVWGYVLSIPFHHGRYDEMYLYGLCGLIVLSAVYLFQTYWIAMRNMMYANR